MAIFACHLKKIIVITSPKCGTTSISHCYENIENYAECEILKMLKIYKIYIVYCENIIKRFLSGFYEDLINNSCYDTCDIPFCEYIKILHNIYLNKIPNVTTINYNKNKCNIWWGECSNSKLPITDENGLFISHIQMQKYAVINYINIFDINYNVEIVELNNLNILVGNILLNNTKQKHDFEIQKYNITREKLQDIKKNVLLNTQNIIDEDIKKLILEMYSEDDSLILFLKTKFKNNLNINT